MFPASGATAPALLGELVEHGQMVIDGTTSRDVLDLLLVNDLTHEAIPVPEDIAQVHIMPPTQAVLANCGLW